MQSTHLHGKISGKTHVGKEPAQFPGCRLPARGVGVAAGASSRSWAARATRSTDRCPRGRRADTKVLRKGSAGLNWQTLRPPSRFARLSDSFSNSLPRSPFMKAHDARPSSSVLIQYSPELRRKEGEQECRNGEPSLSVQRSHLRSCHFCRSAPCGHCRRMFDTLALADREELGSNILHLETPEIQIAGYRSSPPRVVRRSFRGRLVGLGKRTGPGECFRMAAGIGGRSGTPSGRRHRHTGRVAVKRYFTAPTVNPATNRSTKKL
jgi:hypothetical protein